jgi:hypothetical protein
LEPEIDPRALGPHRNPAAAELRRGPAGVLSLLAIFAGNAVFHPLGTFLVLAWALASGTPWDALGLARPPSWPLTALGGLLLGAVLKIFLKALVMPLLGADPINPAYHYLVGNPAALPGILFTAIVGAGFGEELLFRSYLFERLGHWWGTRPPAKVATVGVTAVLFGLAHYSTQGLAGAEQATLTGLVFGALLAVTGRIWLAMFAHAAYDIVAIAIIYGNLETRVAHLIFR